MFQLLKYKILSAPEFQAFVKECTKNCEEENEREVYDAIKDIFANDAVFIINHVRNKFYLRELRWGDSFASRKFWAFTIRFKSQPFNSISSYESTETIWWLMNENPVNWKWKFGVLRSVLNKKIA